MKFVYSFKEGNKDMKNILGGKGANLSEMTNLGLPVPQGFTVTTEACLEYLGNDNKLTDEIIVQVREKLAELESISGKTFGDPTNPLLVSVRSGARVSMPGMMDTVLNLGMNTIVADSFAEATNNARFVYDSYRRFIQMYADVVKGYPKSSFERLFDKIKESKGVEFDTDLTAEDLKEVIAIYKDEYKKLAGTDFPEDVDTQLMEAVKAVFGSWNNERAIAYRRINNISDEWGTAVNVQEMVYGNLGDTSGTGVAFTRNPATGENKLFGEYLMNAQGEDVVAGIRTPKSIETLRDQMPEVYEQFVSVCETLEEHYRDMQDMEFTIENNKLYMLQTRTGKRTAKAAVKIAVDLVSEGKISKEEALLRVNSNDLDQLLHPTFIESELEMGEVIAEGLAASPGAAFGKVYFTADRVKELKDKEADMILVRLETSPEDIEGMHIANGVLTVRGGMTSHAAVVARGMGTCCVSGCKEIKILDNSFEVNGVIIQEGDYISLDGSTGKVYRGKIETEEAKISGNFETFISWADEYSRLEVRANAETVSDASVARDFGAKGIGLSRSEHMFFEAERIFNFRKMILAETKEEREEALKLVIPYQIEDFYNLFKIMQDYVVNVRLLDPPLHEFLPKTEVEKKELADALNISLEEINERIEELKEFNPMMGHRGCRLAVTYPEIARMQATAIKEAYMKCMGEGIRVTSEIMIPLVGQTKEYLFVKEIIDEVIEGTDILVGSMIEVPRSCVIAGELAKDSKFFSFGTNDLTQMTYGFSRDDAANFLDSYYETGIMPFDPFKSVDTEGVGTLIRVAVQSVKAVNSEIEMGVCGEHAGDEESIKFFDKVGLDYISCSPYRVPIAKLAAAKAAILNK